MNKGEIKIFQSGRGRAEVQVRLENESVWLSLEQIAQIFCKNKSTISRHIRNIYNTDELLPERTVAKYATVQQEWEKQVNRNIEYYNLDMIISVGYRVNSKQATQFRIWATNILKSHITDGFTINKNRVQSNYDNFLRAVEEVRKLLPWIWENIKTEDILELIESFANTWLSLDTYDKDLLPKEGFTKTDLVISAQELYSDVARFKSELIGKWEATELFAQEKSQKALEGILWNIFQSFDGSELYPSIEDKAAHFLYFIVKNHPFTDGNKRTGAFSFLWLLRKAGIHFRDTITPQALTAITLLVAESNPKDKERIVGLIILLLKK